MNRRLIVFFLALLIAIAYISPPAETLASETVISNETNSEIPIESKIKAPSAILIDRVTGDILWKKNPDEERPIASTTKMMTAIIALEAANIDDTVVVGRDVVEAGSQGGIKLKPGEKLSFMDLMRALMLYSANDAAVAIAGHVDGSVEGFVSNMNRKAYSLGALHTHFTNPHGLDDEEHYSTARDLSRIAEYGLRNRIFVELVSTKTAKLQRPSGRKPGTIDNRNELLLSYDGANGVKTGHTSDAGYCLVSSAKRGNISLLSVVLGAKSQEAIFTQSAALLDYGFSQYEKKLLIKKGVVYRTVETKYGQKVKLAASDDAYAVVRKSSEIVVEKICKNKIDAPWPKNAPLGTISAMEGDRVIAKAYLITKDPVARPSFVQLASFYWARFAEYMF